MKNEINWKPSRILKTKDGFVINKKYFALASRYMGELFLPYYVNAIKENARGVIFDAGCGQAPYYIIYKDLVESIVCADWDVADNDHDYLDFKVDFNKPLDIIQSESFDTILFADVLEHIYNPEVLFSEISRILKPGGKIILFVPFFYWIHSEPHDYFRHTEFSLTRFCNNNNFTIITLEPYGGYFDILFDLFNKFFVNSEFGYRILRKISKCIKRSRYYKKRLPNRIKNFPMGYILIAEKNESNKIVA